MPRARRITPEFWLDRELSRLPERTRLLYIGIWNFSDCNGIIEYDAEMIRVQVFPYKNLDVETNLNELIKLKKLIPFEANNKKYLWVKNFKKYQQLKKPNYRYPIPPEEVLSQYPTSTPPVDPQCLKKPKQKQKPNQYKEEREFSSEKKLKPTFNGEQMRKAQGKWWVLPRDGGEWLEFAGKESQIQWKP